MIFLAARNDEVDRVLGLMLALFAVLLTVQAVMREARDAQTPLVSVNAVERALKREFPEVSWSFFEPEQAALPNPA